MLCNENQIKGRERQMKANTVQVVSSELFELSDKVLPSIVIGLEEADAFTSFLY